MNDLFLIIALGGHIGMVPFDGDRAACEAAAQREQARLTVLVDPEIHVKCERRGPEHMIWRTHPELKARCNPDRVTGCVKPWRDFRNRVWR